MTNDLCNLPYKPLILLVMAHKKTFYSREYILIGIYKIYLFFFVFFSYFDFTSSSYFRMIQRYSKGPSSPGTDNMIDVNFIQNPTADKDSKLSCLISIDVP